MGDREGGRRSGLQTKLEARERWLLEKLGEEVVGEEGLGED